MYDVSNHEKSFSYFNVSESGQYSVDKSHNNIE